MDARLRYVTDGEGMHTFTDPVDGERYVGGYLGLDITQRLFACFDQLDLKAPITLSVTADPAWTGPVERAAHVAEHGGPGFADHPADPVRSVRGRAPGRTTRCGGSTAACRWAGTPAARWPPSWSATPRSCGG